MFDNTVEENMYEDICRKKFKKQVCITNFERLLVLFVQ